MVQQLVQVLQRETEGTGANDVELSFPSDGKGAKFSKIDLSHWRHCGRFVNLHLVLCAFLSVKMDKFFILINLSL